MLYEDVSRLRKQIKALYRRIQRELPQVEGLPFTAFQMLWVIERATSPISPGQLATEMEMTNSNVAATLRSLEAKGLVLRCADPSDGRKAFIAMTNLGDKVIADNRGSPSAWLLKSIEDSLSEKEQRLLMQAGDLMQRLSEHQEMPAAPNPVRRRRTASSALPQVRTGTHPR